MSSNPQIVEFGLEADDNWLAMTMDKIMEGHGGLVILIMGVK